MRMSMMSMVIWEVTLSNLPNRYSEEVIIILQNTILFLYSFSHFFKIERKEI